MIQNLKKYQPMEKYTLQNGRKQQSRNKRREQTTQKNHGHGTWLNTFQKKDIKQC